MKIGVFIVVGLLSTMCGPVWAACTSPAGTAGEMIYNIDHNVMQFCNDTNWMAMGGSGVRAIGGAGLIQYSDGDKHLASSSLLVFDAVNGRLGVGTPSPQVTLEVRGDIGFTYSALGSSHNGIRRNSYWTEYYNAITSTPSADIHLFTGSGGAHKLVIKESGDVHIAGNAFKPGGGSWAASSDARLKTVEGPYEIGLEQITALLPVRFRYNVDNPRHEPSDEVFVGLVAQDVEKVIPDAVTLGHDGFYNLDTTPIHFAYINAIKTLNARNEALQSEVDDLKIRLEKLERR